MPAPISMDLRRPIIATVEDGSSVREAARRFAVAPSTAIKLMQRVRATGSAVPGRNGHRPQLLARHETTLRALVIAQPALTLAELQAELARRTNIVAGLSTLYKALYRLGLRQKRSLGAAEQDRSDVAQARRRWRACQPFMDPARFVFLDETATATMARRYGRCLAHERLVAAVPHGHWKTTTFVCGLRQDGIVAPLVLDGPMSGRAFRASVEQFLAPALTPGDVVVLDNLAAHRCGVRAPHTARGPTASATRSVPPGRRFSTCRRTAPT